MGAGREVGSRAQSSSTYCVLHSAADMDITTRSAPIANSVSATHADDERVSNELADAQDHYTGLIQLVAETSRDHTQLRGLIYEFARAKLRRELYPYFLDGAWAEIEERILGLERAIVRVEADFGEIALALRPTTSFLPGPARSNPERTGTFRASALRVESMLPGVSQNATLSPHNPRPRAGNSFFGKHLRSRFWRNTQLLLAAAIGFAIYATADPELMVKEQGSSSVVRSIQGYQKAGVERAKAANAAEEAMASKSDAFGSQGKPRPPAIPIPAEYGVYVLSVGKLIELEQLPLKIPDPRVAISAAFPVPGKVHVAPGRLQFVAYRRDLANASPDHVAVRVVAQVVRALSFDSKGHAKTTAVEQTWVVRNRRYELSVAPFADNAEMVLMRSAAPDLVLPAGRYVLVLKGIGYDFTVEGALADKAHCLERTDAPGASFYSECKTL
jgi:hypothetical protein